MLLRQTLGYNAFSTPVFAKAMINLIVNQTCFYQFMSLKVSDALLTLNSICSWKCNPQSQFLAKVAKHTSPNWLAPPPPPSLPALSEGLFSDRPDFCAMHAPAHLINTLLIHATDLERN